MGKEEIIEKLVKKYNVDLEALREEQTKLATQLQTEKDSRDFSNLHHIGGTGDSFFDNKIISSIVVLDVSKHLANLKDEWEVVDKTYFKDKLKFPFIPGFRAYRELPSMLEAFNKLEEKPEVVFVNGHGISHPRLGIASQFSLAAGNIPTIGIAERLINEKSGNVEIKIEDENILKNGKIVGKVLVSKKGSKPLFVSPGNGISVETAFELAQKYLCFPHKLPEPLHRSLRYAKKVREEFRAGSNGE